MHKKLILNRKNKLKIVGYNPTNTGYQPEKNQFKNSSKLPKGGSGESKN